MEDLIESIQTERDANYEELKEIVSKLNLNNSNPTIFRCDHGESDMGLGSGSYDVLNYGPFVYCGTQGFVSVLTEIRPNNDLGHSICNDLRQSDLMTDYSSTFCQKSEYCCFVKAICR